MLLSMPIRLLANKITTMKTVIHALRLHLIPAIAFGHVRRSAAALNVRWRRRVRCCHLHLIKFRINLNLFHLKLKMRLIEVRMRLIEVRMLISKVRMRYVLCIVRLKCFAYGVDYGALVVNGRTIKDRLVEPVKSFNECHAPDSTPAPSSGQPQSQSKP